MTQESNNKKKSGAIRIDPKMNLADLMDTYPEIVDVLAEEFEIYCAMCPMYEYDNLEEASSYHDIENEHFLEMIEYLEDIINKERNK
ncbi:MAG: hypothetical protein Q9M91_02605 [Candidatus Dojkabacteria bacterium]|nr:hypothetical protein [Candidatus Dojkabacteria bacterium]MDQ7020716.1 hypothetical protein [Candidatus Dojkabacteria bacterium]